MEVTHISKQDLGWHFLISCKKVLWKYKYGEHLFLQSYA